MLQFQAYSKQMPDFQSQFSTKKQVDFHGKKISFVDVTPPVHKSPHPIFIAPGWGETPNTFRDLMSLLFDAGFRVISVAHPRQDFKLITKNNISKLEFQKAEIILSVFSFLNLEKVNVVAHSEGAINAVIAAHISPIIFENILLVGPGGLVENEGFFELMGRFIRNTFKNRIRANIELFKYFLKNPVMGLLEGSAISRTHLQGFLIDLHKENISVGIILGTDDVVFPLRKMKSLSEMKWVDFHPMEGDHNDICAHPKNYVIFLEERFKI